MSPKNKTPREIRGAACELLRSGSLAFFILVASGPAKSFQVRRSVPRREARKPAADVAAVVEVGAAEGVPQRRLFVPDDEDGDGDRREGELAEHNPRCVRKRDGEESASHAPIVTPSVSEGPGGAGGAQTHPPRPLAMLGVTHDRLHPCPPSPKPPSPTPNRRTRRSSRSRKTGSRASCAIPLAR